MLSPSSSRTYVRLAFLVSVVLLSCLLTSRYKLEAPYNRPYGKPVNLGHQAYQLTFARPAGKAAAGAATAGTTDAAIEAGEKGTEDEYWDEGDDWDMWGVASTKAGWDPLDPSTTPLTELQVKSCVLSPGLYDMCSPTSPAKEDATRGKWERIDRDINKRAGIYYLYIYARRLLPGSTADVITDLRLLDHRPTTEDLSADGLWVEVSTSMREGVWPRMDSLFLHYKLTPQADVLAARRMDTINGSAGALEPITELDVLYGGEEVHALPGYTKVTPVITGGEKDHEWVGNGHGKRVGASLAYRKEISQLPPAPTLRFDRAGNFSILQVADLHFSVGPGECRDLDPRREAECQKLGADVYSLHWLETALDEVKPDLVVFSGDQLNGQKTSWDAKSVILKWAPLVYKRQIPWTIIFGNHDEEETDLKHAEQIELMRHLPLFVGEVGPSSVSGEGNYVRPIRAPAAANDDTALFNLYFLDSHAYAKKRTPWSDPGYDWLKANQINWFRGRSAQMKTFMRPYTPPRAIGGAQTKPAAAQKGAAAGAGDGGRQKWHAYDPTVGGAALDDRAPPSVFARSRRGVALNRRQEEENGDFGTAVEPFDPADAVENPQDDISFETEGEGDGTSSKEADGETEYASSNPLLDAEEALLEEEGFLEPSELPIGPTVDEPMEAKPNAITFFHIPLPQAYNSEIDVGPDGKRLRVGNRYEGSGASKTDSGFFEQAILAQGELPAPRGDGDAPVDAFWDGEAASPTAGRPEVKVLAHGHCHLTSDCRRVQGVWICFGGGATYSGYGSKTFSRRMRVYQLSDFGERIETFQLTDEKERVNHAILVGEGSLEQAP
ncbi:uncharacterized protein JCM10292_004466 [Rhodotorula paludigena]|uniref:uncharacterized protein n=1 Tax=Rhodotorula paludigena TaxID=86838 RepID=UPI0031715F8F